MLGKERKEEKDRKGEKEKKEEKEEIEEKGIETKKYLLMIEIEEIIVIDIMNEMIEMKEIIIIIMIEEKSQE